AYYAGVVEERWGKALLLSGYTPPTVFRRLRAAMAAYESAQSLAPAGNDDATLRWNACVRIIERHDLAPPEGGEGEGGEVYDDDVPMRWPPLATGATGVRRICGPATGEAPLIPHDIRRPSRRAPALAALCCAAASCAAAPTLEKIGGLSIPGAEIPAYDPATR